MSYILKIVPLTTLWMLICATFSWACIGSMGNIHRSKGFFQRAGAVETLPGDVIKKPFGFDTPDGFRHAVDSVSHVINDPKVSAIIFCVSFGMILLIVLTGVQDLNSLGGYSLWIPFAVLLEQRPDKWLIMVVILVFGVAAMRGLWVMNNSWRSHYGWTWNSITFSFTTAAIAPFAPVIIVYNFLTGQYFTQKSSS